MEWAFSGNDDGSEVKAKIFLGLDDESRFEQSVDSIDERMRDCEMGMNVWNFSEGGGQMK